MMIKRIDMYATRNDWLRLLGHLESLHEICYVPQRQESNEVPKMWRHAADIPNLGIALGTDTIRCDHFRLFMRKQGESQFDVVLSPGGEFNETTIISGNVATLHDEPDAQAIMKTLKAEVKKRFKRVQAYWVGEEALRRLDSGARLTLNYHASSEFNLTI